MYKYREEEKTINIKSKNKLMAPCLEALFWSLEFTFSSFHEEKNPIISLKLKINRLSKNKNKEILQSLLLSPIDIEI